MNISVILGMTEFRSIQNFFGNNAKCYVFNAVHKMEAPQNSVQFEFHSFQNCSRSIPMEYNLEFKKNWCKIFDLILLSD